MTTDSEEQVRTLLNAAAPEPTRTFDGSEIRRAADVSPGDALPRGPRRTSTTVSVVLAVAAVVIVALVAVGLGTRDGHRGAPAAGNLGTPGPSAPTVSGPRACGNTLVLAAGRFTGPSGGDGSVALTIRGSRPGPCTVPRLPSTSLTFDGGVVSKLAASRYQPPYPVVVGAHRSVRIVVALRAEHTCAGMGVGRTQIVFALDGFSYGFDQHLDGCRYAITSARVHRGQ